MNLLSFTLATLAVTSPAELGREMLFENSTTQVYLQRVAGEETVHDAMVLVKWSNDRRAQLVLSCHENTHLRAKIVVSAIGFSDPKFGQVLAYQVDEEQEIRVHGQVQPAGNWQVAFVPDIDFLRSVSKSNTRFFRDIVGRARLQTSFKVAGRNAKHVFSLGEIGGWIVNIGKRCGRNLTEKP